MDNTLILQELESLAVQLGVELRYEALEEGSGGLCRYKGRLCLIANRELRLAERIRLLSRELGRLPLEGVFVRPSVRQLLEAPGTSLPRQR